MDKSPRRTRQVIVGVIAALLIVSYLGAYLITTEVKLLPLPTGPTRVRTMNGTAYRIFTPLRIIDSSITGMPTATGRVEPPV